MCCRIFAVILRTFIVLDIAAKQDHLPHHRKDETIADAKVLLLSLQGYDSIIIGIYKHTYTYI